MDKKVTIGNYQICTKCIMDTSDPGIQFDRNEVCNHCKEYEQRINKEVHYDLAGQERFKRIIDKIKEEGKCKKYDCIIGMSGGIDSTILAYHAKNLGLRPLAVHLDNGWNTALAVNNLKKALKKLGIDLYTYVLDWESFRDLQLSFLKASVANSELPTDHAIISILYHTAAKQNVRYILTGSNTVTEGIFFKGWIYDEKDWKFIKGIHEKFGELKLKNFRHLALCDWIYYIFVKRIKWLPLLNYIPYVKKEVKEFLKKEFDWEDYGEKHYESIYARFLQGYILLTKFGFDRRRAYLSALICSGQITREGALAEMEKKPYPTEEMLKNDKNYIIKKFRLSEDEFERIMISPIKTFKDYSNNSLWFIKMRFLLKLVKKIATHNY